MSTFTVVVAAVAIAISAASLYWQSRIRRQLGKDEARLERLRDQIREDVRRARMIDRHDRRHGRMRR